jgi:3-oxoacyl-[acyl-carrier protein] reductase
MVVSLSCGYWSLVIGCWLLVISSTFPAIPMSLTGKTALVTGASSGIGRAIALEFAAAGASVVVHAGKNRTGAEETAQLIRDKGQEALVLLADLSHPPLPRGEGQGEGIAPQTSPIDDPLTTLVQTAWSWRGGLDILVNNAGADVLSPPVSDWSFEDKLNLLWQVDVLGTIRLSRLIADRMKSRPDRAGGVILNMGWDQAEHGMAGDSGQMFGAIKGAIISFTKSLAQTAAPEVRVHCLAPGWIRTSWGEGASDYWQSRAIAESLVGRWGTPEDVAQVAHFLASDAASFLTGQVVPINGGWRRRQE